MFAERALLFVVVAAALAVAPADARMKKARATGPIDAAERAAIAADLVFVREEGTVREARVMHASGDAEHALLPAQSGVDTYPAAVARDGAVAVVRVLERGEAHEESLVVRTAAGSTRAVGAPAAMVRHPGFAPDGRVVYESSALSFRDLFAESTRLTDDAYGNYEPSWFPDGSALAFTSSRDGEAEIYRMNADGSGARKLTATAGDDVQPKVSPTGQRIAFLSGRAGVDRVFVMDAAGGGQRLVRPIDKTNEETEREHTWSSDGGRLAFVARGHGTKSRILVWDAERDTTRALTDGSSADDMPSFSPDGRYLAFVSDRGGRPDVWIMRADGSGATRAGRTADRRWLPSWVTGRR